MFFRNLCVVLCCKVWGWAAKVHKSAAAIKRKNLCSVVGDSCSYNDAVPCCIQGLPGYGGSEPGAFGVVKHPCVKMSLAIQGSVSH